MATEIKEVTTNVEHPLEDVFDIEEKSTELTTTVRETELTEVEEYDVKDNEIETQFQEIYDCAMDAFDNSFSNTSEVEGKYKARNGEVAVQFLNAALNAANAKAALKKHKDKLTFDAKKAQTPQTLNQNLIVTDRNELLKHLSNTKD